MSDELIEAALVEIALEYSPLTDDIGSRLYPKSLPQNPTYPAITYFRVSGPRHNDVEVAYPRFQFDTWADGANSYKVAQRVANNLKKAFNWKSGTWNGIRIVRIVFLDDRDVPDESSQPDHIASDFKVIYRD
jgi:hypothetical protein